MKRVALTGGIGSGKTTVANEFCLLGIPCFVADKAGAELYNDASFCGKVIELLGDDVAKADGMVSKRAVAEIIFSDKAKLKALNELIHPRVMKMYHQWEKKWIMAPYTIFECAILYEYHLEKQFDKVVSVYTSIPERIARLQIRDNATISQIMPFINAQIPAEEKMMRSDYVILNYEGNPRVRQVKTIHDLILKDSTFSE